MIIIFGTGWSASRPAPYMITRLEQMSRSKMDLGNHGAPDRASEC